MHLLPSRSSLAHGRQKIAEREAAIAELRATRDAALEGQLVVSDSSATPEPEEGAEGGEDADRAHHRAERRRAKAMAKAEAATARLRQLEGAHGRSASTPSSEDDDAMWDYIDVDVAAPPKHADLDSPAGRCACRNIVIGRGALTRCCLTGSSSSRGRYGICTG